MILGKFHCIQSKPIAATVIEKCEKIVQKMIDVTFSITQAVLGLLQKHAILYEATNSNKIPVEMPRI